MHLSLIAYFLPPPPLPSSSSPSSSSPLLAKEKPDKHVKLGAPQKFMGMLCWEVFCFKRGLPLLWVWGGNKRFCTSNKLGVDVSACSAGIAP